MTYGKWAAVSPAWKINTVLECAGEGLKWPREQPQRRKQQQPVIDVEAVVHHDQQALMSLAWNLVAMERCCPTMLQVPSVPVNLP